MKRLWLLLALLSLPAFGEPLSAAAPLPYRNAKEEARFHALTSELRCVQCQNQSLADSNAQIADDLRREVLVLMQHGRSNAQIKQFLVERYGEFVLYRPRLEPRTWLLWFGPLGLCLIGVAALGHQIRRQHAGHVPFSSEEQEW